MEWILNIPAYYFGINATMYVGLVILEWSLYGNIKLMKEWESIKSAIIFGIPLLVTLGYCEIKKLKK